MKLLLILALVLAIWAAIAWTLRLRSLAAALWFAAFLALVVTASVWR